MKLPLQFTTCLTMIVLLTAMNGNAQLSLTANFNYTVSGLTVNFTDATNYMGCIPMVPDWDFGDPSSNNNQSNLSNPSFTYSSPGTYTVFLMVNVKPSCSYSGNLTSQTITITGTSGITANDGEKKIIHIYPNPVTDNVNINIGRAEKGTIAIFDITGKVVLRSEIEGSGINKVDLTDLSDGIYNLRYTSENGVVENEKFIKN